MGTTPRGYAYPEPTALTDIPGDIQALAEDVDADVTGLSATYLSRVVIAAGALAPIGPGSPSLSTVGSGWHTAWLLDAATDESVGGPVVVPTGWATFDVRVWWTNAGAGSGNVVFRSQHAQPIDGSTLTSAVGSNGTVAAPAQNVLKMTTVEAGIAVAVGTGFVGLGVQRRGGDAADTLANDVAILAIELVKAS